ncbi:CapA family protein [Vibrio neonatus]|uniref:CapA family protein n=1 Tax=Vibrio neonatus TaxID=278860 RepID=UPI0021C39320|nr:CapA family protein [Vibrio neonatus]
MVNLFACGDIVNYNNADGFLLTEELATIVKNADYSICNFEAPIHGYGSPQTKSGIHHSQREETISGLKAQGFNLALLANNHIMDFGREGLEATIDEANKSNIETLGAGTTHELAYAPLIKVINGLKIGILNGGEAQFGVIDHFERDEQFGYAWINHPRIDRTILKLKEECDFILVFSHAGLEDYNIPQKEWRERYKHLCDLGADAVIGSHPHVPQGHEKHNDSLIFYSLGNFYFDGGRWAGIENNSFSIVLTMSKDIPITFKPVFHHTSNGKVHISKDEKKINLEALCGLLRDEYYIHHDQMAINSYQNVKNNLLKSLSPLPITPTLKGTVKELIRAVIGRRKGLNKAILGMHFMRNESYYFVAKHAMELEVQKKKKNE